VTSETVLLTVIGADRFITVPACGATGRRDRSTLATSVYPGGGVVVVVVVVGVVVVTVVVGPVTVEVTVGIV
jgi:hypothetical protein